MTWIKQVNNTIHFSTYNRYWKIKIKNLKKKCNITKLICYLYHVHLTAEHIYLKQKKSKFTRLLHKNYSGTPGLWKRKTVPNKNIHSSPAYKCYNIVLPYKTATKMRWPKHYALYYIITVKNWWNHIEQLYKNKGPKNWVNLYRSYRAKPSLYLHIHLFLCNVL